MVDVIMNLQVEKEIGYRIQVNLPDNIDEYAKNFLKIYNNVKSHRELLKMYNDYDNGVYLIVRAEDKDQTVDWLKWFGEIVDVEEIVLYVPYLEYKSKLYKQIFDYDDDIDYEFVDIEDVL